MEIKGDRLKCKYLSLNMTEDAGFFLKFNAARKSLGDSLVPTIKQKYSIFNV